MKKRILFLFVFACSLFGAMGFAAENPHLIAVNGVAERAVEPNMTVLQIESWGKAVSAKVAQETQASQFAKIKLVVEKYKVKKEDFQTENFTVTPETVYDQKTLSNKIVGYRVSHQINLIYRKTDDAGALIDALTAVSKSEAGGGVSIQNISWDYDKKNIVEMAALADAVKVGRAKAEELAKAAGVRIKGVYRIQYITSGGGVARPMMALRAMKAMADSSESSSELSSGQVKVRVDVQMEFEVQ